MANELSALAEAVGATVDRFMVTPAQSLHAAIARRAFGPLGIAATPARGIHDRIATGVYSSVRSAVMGATSGAAGLVRAAGGAADIRPLSRSSLGRLALGAANAVAGDHLDERKSDLAITMALRADGADVACDAAGLRQAFPSATGRVAVFIHGLAETEQWWWRGRLRGATASRTPFGAALQRDLGMTPVYLRYNTGLHISENGRRLDHLLQAISEAWPVEVTEMALVGHSMGGLVARSACDQAGIVSHDRWASRVRHLITLGTPHTGAPMAKAAHAISWALSAVPESRPAAAVMAVSAGISDLTFGYLRDEDWKGAVRSRPFKHSRADVPLLPGCTHTFIGATVTAHPAHPLGRVAGDLLVRTESANGSCRERAIPVGADARLHVGGITHFDLLDHPLVYEHLHRTLGRDAVPPTAAPK